MQNDNPEIKITNVYERLPKNGSKPKHMVILLHGYGADGADLIELAPILGRMTDDCVFIAPDAPFRCEEAPSGYQWFSLIDRSDKAINKGAEKVLGLIHGFIDKQLEKHDIAPENLILSGFSQGAALSIYCGIRYKKEIAGILGFSGWLIDKESVLDKSATKNKPPITLMHGQEDMLVTPDMYEDAVTILRNAGYQVDGDIEEHLGHGISTHGMQTGISFIKECFS